MTVRVSTEQVAGLEAQERDLRAAGVEKVFAEQISSLAILVIIKRFFERAPGEAPEPPWAMRPFG
jgi:hypothetical protein